MKGGYQILDFSGVTLSSTATNVPGIYTLAQTGKVLLLEGLGQTQWAPAQKALAGADIEITLANGDTLTIDSDDDVTVTSV